MDAERLLPFHLLLRSSFRRDNSTKKRYQEDAADWWRDEGLFCRSSDELTMIRRSPSRFSKTHSTSAQNNLQRSVGSAVPVPVCFSFLWWTTHLHYPMWSAISERISPSRKPVQFDGTFSDRLKNVCSLALSLSRLAVWNSGEFSTILRDISSSNIFKVHRFLFPFFHFNSTSRREQCCKNHHYLVEEGGEVQDRVIASQWLKTLERSDSINDFIIILSQSI